jgi:hypothetical protein
VASSGQSGFRCTHTGPLCRVPALASSQPTAFRPKLDTRLAPHSRTSAAGLLFFRHGPNTTSFIDAWQRTLDADSKVTGCQHQHQHLPEASVLCRCNWGRVQDGGDWCRHRQSLPSPACYVFCVARYWPIRHARAVPSSQVLT